MGGPDFSKFCKTIIFILVFQYIYQPSMKIPGPGEITPDPPPIVNADLNVVTRTIITLMRIIFYIRD